MAEESHVLKGIRILVVDDDREALEAVSALLEMNGAEVRNAHRISEAKEILDTFRPDLVITDLSMPGGDGFDLVMGIRMLPPDAGRNIPVIAFSASSDVETRDRVLSSGFQRFVPKPVDPMLLLSAVAELTRRKAG